MIAYKKIIVSDLKKNTIEENYQLLLKEKLNFLFLMYQKRYYVLTKEKTYFPIQNIHKFVEKAKQNIYFQTIIESDTLYEEEDLKLYYYYLELYKKKILKNKNGNYQFGTIAVRTSHNHFITTIRGKKDIQDFTVVNKVDIQKNFVFVFPKKATLNAPLLYQLFQNKRVKVIVHLHEYDKQLPFDTYEEPGTIQDSIRNYQTSFNIQHHGVFLLLDKNGTIL